MLVANPSEMPGATTVAALSLVSYQDGAVVSRILLKRGGGTVTLFAFDEGQSLSEHTAPFDAVAHVLEGEALITIAGVPLTVPAGVAAATVSGPQRAATASLAAATSSAHITMKQAKHLARAAVPHSRVIEIESDDFHDRAVWKVKLATPHGRVVVAVDKKTGTVTILGHRHGGGGGGRDDVLLSARSAMLVLAGEHRGFEPGDDRGFEPGDDHGIEQEPGDDNGIEQEPGDDNGVDQHADDNGVDQRGDDNGMDQRGDDHGQAGQNRGPGNGGQDDGSGHDGGHGGSGQDG